MDNDSNHRKVLQLIGGCFLILGFAIGMAIIDGYIDIGLEDQGNAGLFIFLVGVALAGVTALISYCLERKEDKE